METKLPLRRNRWWIYQAERFPLLAHGPLIAVFSLSALRFSAHLRGADALPEAGPALAATAGALLFFLQLRIADEFKDYEDDLRYRPYRAVPRGLVSLRELGRVGLVAAGLQLLLALAVAPALLPLLAVVWGYLALMRFEFFAAHRLRRRPAAYLLSHMVVVPLIALYVSAFDWAVQGVRPPAGLAWLLLASFCCGIVLEIGRKVRAPEDEEPGVETYTAQWGPRPAVAAWLAALLFSATAAAVPAATAGSALPLGLAAAGALALGAAGRFLRRPTPRHSRALEVFSGVWTLLLYASFGLLPLF